MAENECRSVRIEFREAETNDCHIEAAIDIDGFGAWKQHLWLKAPTDADRKFITSEAE